MCGRIMQAVWDYDGDDLDFTQSAVLTRLAWYSAFDGSRIFPSLETVAEQTKACLRTVNRVMKYLRDAGFIVLDKHYKESDTNTNHYKINLAKLGISEAELYKTKRKPKLSTETGDNSAQEKHHSDSQSPRPSVSESHNRRSSKDDHKYIHAEEKEKVVDKIVDSSTKHLYRVLLQIGVDGRSIARWTQDFGQERVMSIYRDVEQERREKPSKIKNPGAYMRSIIDSLSAYSKAG